MKFIEPKHGCPKFERKSLTDPRYASRKRYLLSEVAGIPGNSEPAEPYILKKSSAWDNHR